MIWEYRHLPQKWSCFDRKTVAERHSYWMELAAVRAKIMEKKPKEEQKPVHCMEGGCASCSNEACSGKFYDNTVVKK